VSEIGSCAFAESGSSDTPLEGLTICGYTGSEAEEYANDKGIPFQSLGVCISRDGSSLPYTDLNVNAWYMPSVRKVIEKGLMTGTSATTFGPDKNITRAMFAAILYRLEGRPAVSYSEIFSDVPDGEYYSLAVTWASENGIIAGTGSGKFSPDDNITRAQMAAIMYRYATYKGSDIGEYAPIYNYPDMPDVRPFARRPLKWAVYFKVLTGKNKSGTYYLCPNNDATRAECAAIIVRYTENIQVSGTTVNVTDCGAVANDGEDDTAAFGRAIEKLFTTGSDLDTVYVPSGTFNIDLTNSKVGIYLKSNARLIMNSSAILKVNGTSREDYQVIKASNMNNVIISGGTLIGERYIHEGTSGEGGMGINLYDSTNVTIADMTITKNWADGIYLGSVNDDDTLYGCDNITIDNCRLQDNRRTNVSIVDADNVTINDCIMHSSDGVAPQCNINIEPDDNGAAEMKDRAVQSDQVCKNITIQYSTIYGETNSYSGQYFCFRSQYAPTNVNYITSDNLKVRHCAIHGDCGNYSTTNASIYDTDFYGEDGTFYDGHSTDLSGCTFHDNYCKYTIYW
jgi:parallel beta-helix repeat protein